MTITRVHPDADISIGENREIINPGSFTRGQTNM